MEDKQNKQRKSKKFLIILGVLIICLVGFFIYKSTKKTPSSAITTTTTKIQGYKICSKSITDSENNNYNFTLYQNNSMALVNITNNHNESIYYNKLEGFLIDKTNTSKLCVNMKPTIINIKSTEDNYKYIVVKYTINTDYEYYIISINNNVYSKMVSLAALTSTTYKSGNKTLPLFTLGTNKITTYSNGCFDEMNISTNVEDGKIPKYDIILKKGKYTFKQVGNETLTTSGISCW